MFDAEKMSAKWRVVGAEPSLEVVKYSMPFPSFAVVPSRSLTSFILQLQAASAETESPATEEVSQHMSENLGNPPLHMLEVNNPLSH